MYGERFTRVPVKACVPRAMQMSMLYKVRLDHTFVAYKNATEQWVLEKWLSRPPQVLSRCTRPRHNQAHLVLHILQEHRAGRPARKSPLGTSCQDGDQSAEPPPLCRNTRVGVQCAHEAPLYPTSRPVRGWEPVPCVPVRKESLAVLGV